MPKIKKVIPLAVSVAPHVPGGLYVGIDQSLTGTGVVAFNDKGELTGPVLETIVITGISEDALVTMTVDNCKPRSATDVLYTSALFRNLPVAQRAEYSRMTAAAIKKGMAAAAK